MTAAGTGKPIVKAPIDSQVSSVEEYQGIRQSKGPTYLTFLKITDWKSELEPIQKILAHLARKTRSEGSKRNYCWHIYNLCRTSRKSPEALVKLRRDVAERLVQDYADSLKDDSPRYSNQAISTLKTFYWTNGYKRNRALELETYHAPKRFRKTPEYIPTKSECYRMADSAGSLRDRTIILTMYSSGLRNSTLRALLYRDLEGELSAGICNIKLPVYPEMKKIDPSACKNNISYYSFLCDEATQSLRLHLKEREVRFGQIRPTDPLFATEDREIRKENRPRTILSARQLQTLVKLNAKRAGIPKWEAVHPHSLRKSFQSVMRTPMIDGTNLDVGLQEALMGHILPNSRDNYLDLGNVEHMRLQYSKLHFGRAVVEDKFRVIRLAVARAFEGTDIDPEKAIEEYVRNKKPAERSAV